ncbi:hypothetical protein LCGC14_0165000 [marine sediment metagenome]|uniref:Uncharacterized protein n=1 Tax=marine sediment metagenome TaxID=412755 RepID=A0A0F9XCZ6_9ZZZZ
MDFWPNIKVDAHPDAPITILREAAKQFNQQHKTSQGRHDLEAWVKTEERTDSADMEEERVTPNFRLHHSFAISIDVPDISRTLLKLSHVSEAAYPVSNDIVGEKSLLENADELRMVLQQYFKSDLVQGVIRNMADAVR